MAARQFWHAGGEVYATGAVPVSDIDAAALMELFADHLALAAAAGARASALAWECAAQNLRAALAARDRWRAAGRPRLAA